MKNNVIESSDDYGARHRRLVDPERRSRSAQHSLHTHGRRRRPANRIKGTERASHRSQGFEDNFLKVSLADWLILLLPTAQGG